MKSFTVLVFVLCAASSAWAAAGPAPSDKWSGISKRPKHLRNFKSEQELRAFLRTLGLRYRRAGVGYGAGTGSGDGSAASASVDVTVSDGGGGGGGREEQEVITNVQTVGVDEGSIVKLRDNFLVILRRGRLFTIDIGTNKLTTVSIINAYGPNIDPEDTWYDEMLISGDNVVVIGYSYERGGTEVGLFKLDKYGKLTYRATYHLRSNDYYSSRNYSSRLVGDKLLFYAPLRLDFDEKNVFDGFPGVRRWHKGATGAEFRPITRPTDVYVPDGYSPDPTDLTLHTVTSCQINDGFVCKAESVMGPSGDVFYVSRKNVYVWTSNWYSEQIKSRRSRGLLFKIPLEGGGKPAAIRVSGSPVDQLSFTEDPDEELNVLIRANGDGDGMWSSEVTEGDVALLRLRSDAFGNGTRAANKTDYQKLEQPAGYSFQNRFIGDYALYGSSNYYGEKSAATNVVYALNRRSQVLTKIELTHDVRRLDLLGSDGIVVGSRGDDLAFSSLKLDGSPRIVDSYFVEDAEQGETRSQGYFYKPENPAQGMLALPMIRPLDGSESASIIFLRNSDLRFLGAGELAATATAQKDDGCKASCVDWYGDARPIFAKGRIFGLLGYELVEGSLSDGRVKEVNRINFSTVGGQ